MEKLIPVINKLQDVFNAVGVGGIDLPQIVVVGGQSTGKSSVLENIVGRDFLPRGSGIVTRRPLILQLNRIPLSDSGDEEWGVFSHNPSQIFTDFQKIKEEIERETDRLTGSNKGISSQAISLKIYSPYVLDLTLVDLPGMTRVPVGDQPTDIEQRIRKMILKFITNESAIILAVSAGNQDLANSDALQLARQVDPEGKRTLGVITKCDILDRGTSAMEIFEGKIIPLKLGYIGVINRSQHDIVSGKSIRDAVEDEKQYFENHPVYAPIAYRLGTKYLAKTLNNLLLNHIHDTLPALRRNISELLHEAEMEMKSYGNEPYHEDKGALLLSIITHFAESYNSIIEGKAEMDKMGFGELYGGARINYIFSENFGNCINMIDALDGLTTDDIRTAIRNATGPRNALFIPENAFELLVKRQIERLEEPSLECVDQVFDELLRIVNQIESPELVRFISLRDKIIDTMTELLFEYRKPTKRMVSYLIRIELAYINTAHPDFVGTSGAINDITDSLVEKRVQERESQVIAEHEARKAALQSAENAVNPNNGQPPVPSRTSQPNVPTRQSQPITNVTPSEGKGLNWTGYLSSTNKPKKKKKKIVHSLDAVPKTIRAEDDLSEREEFETQLIEQLLRSYFEIVRKNIVDTIPKAIIHYLVNKSQTTIQNSLVAKLYKDTFIDELLSESPEIVQRRKRTKLRLKNLRQAKSILDEVRQYDVSDMDDY
eukprot:TRINITY_DN4876_c0_g1_i1.p1 TRINITY_DN4876_c0_g1~~TRINITY_DN4876_c0_g1_i1.p1  ORF type:complete len:717 (+),score=179.00 TRINITY_DN4876_c0_g1_i1:14-2164(+)